MNSASKEQRLEEQIAQIIYSVKNQIYFIAQNKGGYAGGDRDGEDLLHDVCAKCIEKSLTNPGFLLDHPEPKAKVLQIATRICIDSYRHRHSFPYECVAKEVCSSDVLLDDLYNAISSLPQHLSVVLSYRFIERRSRTETAALLNVSVHTITRRQQEAIDRLKEHFDLPSNNLILRA